MIQPLGVVNHAHQRPSAHGLDQQSQGGDPGQQRVRRAGIQSEGDLESLPLRRGERLELTEQGRAQLVQRRERQLHLELHAGGTHIGLPEMLQQGALADPRLTSQQQRPTAAPARRRDQGIEPGDLILPTDQRIHIGENYRRDGFRRTDTLNA